MTNRKSQLASEAIDQVITMITAELHSDGRWTENSTIEVEEIHKDDEAFELYAPGTGFTFSVEE